MDGPPIIVVLTLLIAAGWRAHSTRTALSKDRTLRHQTGSELRADLLRLKRDTDAPVIGPAPVKRLPHRNRSGVDSGGSEWPPRCSSRWPASRHVQRDRLRALLTIPEWQEIQLTTNSYENPVTAAAISPDGKYL